MSIQVIHGDCRAVLPSLPANSVQCVVTSPPYFGLRAYLPDGHSDKPKEIGTETSPAAYVAQLVDVFREVKRVLRDDGTIFLNLGDSYAGGKTGRGDQDRNTRNTDGRDTSNASMTGAPFNAARPVPDGYKPKDLLGIPWRVAFALQDDGWYLRSAIVWAKPNAMPESVSDRPTSSYEHVFLLTKAERYYYDNEAIAEPALQPEGEPRLTAQHKASAGGFTTNGTGNSSLGSNQGAATRNARNVWTIATTPYSGAHFATMPPALAERCILAGTSERGCCAACGAPWVRQVAGIATVGRRDCGGEAGGVDLGMYTGRAGSVVRHTTGWAPSCGCDAPTRPCVVLDPFAGAGTTCLVADRLQREAIGIELNPAYAAMARNRVTADCPLFADVAD